MRACFIVLFLALFSGCQSLPLFDSIVRQDSTLSFGKLGGPRGEVVISIVADSSGTVFAGTPGKGVYRSTDAGKSWEATALQEGAVYPLYVTPTGKLFAFIRKSFFDRTIAVSIDKGNTWEILPGKYDRYIGSTVMRFMGGTIYSEGMKEYRIGGAGLHRSTDDGVTWTTLQDDALSQHCSGEYPLEILSDSSMFITCSDGIYHSRDQGISWRKLPLPFGYFSGLRQDPKGGVRTEVQDSIMDPDSRSLIRIDPSGDSWEVVSSKRPLLDRSSPMVLQSGTVLIGNEAWSTGIWRSVDRGHSWQETSLTAGAVNDFCETPDGKVYVAMHGAIFTSADDGRTWMESSGGLGPRSITQLFKDDSRNIWAGTALGGLFRSTDNGSSWSRSTPGLYDVQRGFSLAPGHVLIGTGSAIPDAIYERKGNIRIRCFVFGGWEIHVSHDTGATWTSPNVRSWGNRVIEPGQDMHVYTSGQEHNFSTDGGDTWSTEAMFSGARDIQATSG
ncbi:MAG: hypothetical protein KFH87_07235, partial [Bacteroidetes bacterium]|nr:hypothetical protein [Bacteroidota bacterium]